MAKLITTDSYYNLFPILISELQKDGQGLDKSNLVFCEEKISLYVERFICSELKGSFNTDVYSFGNFLRVNKKADKILSKEGSAMVIKRILSSLSLKCFKSGKVNLAPVLFELISQLKSAKIGVEEIALAVENTGGILKNKLEDVLKVFTEYENFISATGYDDQSSMLSYLPQIISTSQRVKNSKVYIVGFSGWTSQIKAAVTALLNTSKEVVAIFVENENQSAYVNETAKEFQSLCSLAGKPLFEEFVKSDFVEEGRIIASGLFDPTFKAEKIKTDKVFTLSAKNPEHELSAIAQEIKTLVNSGKYRYKDISIAVNEGFEYFYQLQKQFNLLEIPHYIDQKRKVNSHPLITLILSYIDCFRLNFETHAITSFFTNPLFNKDKVLSDEFSNYLLRYKINYSRIKTPFTLENKGNIPLEKLEQFRGEICSLFNGFSVKGLLKTLDVENKLELEAELLKEYLEEEESAVSKQIFKATISLLDEMELILGSEKLSLREYKNIFISGVSAMEMSIIPQHNDAVFIGSYKQIALAKSKCLFACGLTSSVPGVKEDVALLSDSDIDALEEIKILIEPKIKIVNHRQREQVVSAISSFADRLYLSYPICTQGGKKNVKSEILTFIGKNFECKEFDITDNYLTKKQGVLSFSKACSDFVNRDEFDFTEAASFFKAIDGQDLQFILDKANKTVKVRLDGERQLLKGKTSPTTIEDYYKCPYSSFLSHVVKLKDRDQCEVNSLSIGTLFHDILERYAREIDKVNDQDSSNKIFEEIVLKVLENEDYKRFFDDPANSASIDRALNECKKYCYKTYYSLKNSQFKVERTEQKFGGEDKDYPAISLLDGQVKLTGKIDRIDTYGDYFRIIDYKTGATDMDDKLLFAGTKLQLYLYAAVVKNKKLAGAYYLKISDKYRDHLDKIPPLAEGKTLNDPQVIAAQDEVFFADGESEFLPIKLDKEGNPKGALDQETLTSYVNYALKLCENAAKQIQDGVIIASPFGDVCKYCKYKALCFNSIGEKREIGGVDQDTIRQAVEGGEDQCQN